MLRLFFPDGVVDASPSVFDVRAVLDVGGDFDVGGIPQHVSIPAQRGE